MKDRQWKRGDRFTYLDLDGNHAYGTVIAVEDPVEPKYARRITVLNDDRPGEFLICPYYASCIVKGEIKED